MAVGPVSPSPVLEYTPEQEKQLQEIALGMFSDTTGTETLLGGDEESVV
jgi:hypothetical protein